MIVEFDIVRKSVSSKANTFSPSNWPITIRPQRSLERWH